MHARPTCLVLASFLSLAACGGGTPPAAPPAEPPASPVADAPPAVSAAPVASAAPAASSAPKADALPNPSQDNDSELVHYVNEHQKPVNASLSFDIRDASGTSHGDLIKALEASAHDDLCFKSAILKHEGGSLAFTITIDAAGKTKTVKGTRDDLKEGTISKCLEAALRKVPWLTPTDKVGAQATLVWTLTES